MKKVLCICNTYYQLIEAIQLKCTLLQKDEVSVAFSDHSRNAELITKRLSKHNVFSRCYFWQSKKQMTLQPQKRMENLSILAKEITGSGGFGNSFENEAYDELIYYNQFDNLKVVFAELYNQNPNIKVSRFEEGIFSYGDGEYSAKKDKIVNPLRKVLGKKSLVECQGNFYCFYPEFYKGQLMPVRIPKIEAGKETAQLLSELFSTSNIEYSQKYIFFSSVYDFEGGKPIGELDIIKKVAALVGNENLIVKVHPRDSIERFAAAGLNIDTNSTIPWEAIQLGRDFSQHIFLTVNSGSVLSVSMLQEKAPKIYFLYKLCDLDGNPVAANCVHSIDDLLTDNSLPIMHTTVSVPTNLNDIVN